MSRRWYKLDNAAKIFPSVSNRGRTNVFRLSFEMKEEVDPLLLQHALEQTIKRFPMLNVRLRKGMFWYYFEDNDQTPKVEEENPYICRMFEGLRDNNGFKFRLSYFDKRISLETFHSLTDGTGALEFLKSIVYTYLELQDITISASNILTEEVEMINEESLDYFNLHYNAKLKNTRKEVKALQFKSPQYEDDWLGVIIGTADVKQIKDLSKKYDCTITELLGANIIYSAFKSIHLFESKDKPFALFIPVNLRRFFPSKTLRNFSLYVRTMIKFTQDLTFEEVLTTVKQDMKDELQKEKLQTRFTSTVRTERNIVMRLAPRVIKEIALKIGYKLLADSINSFSFSNLGSFDLPKEMKEHIEKVIFTTGASRKTPMNLGVISFNNKIVMTFSSFLIDRSLQKEFFRFLSNEGVDIVIENNELEV
jgi:NRPS condensation-like uncharacterized protein